MNREELTKEWAKELGVSHVQAKAAEKALETIIVAVLARGESVDLKGFGSFYLKDMAARKVFAPLVNSYVDVPARKSPAFRFSSAVKAELKK